MVLTESQTVTWTGFWCWGMLLLPLAWVMVFRRMSKSTTTSVTCRSANYNGNWDSSLLHWKGWCSGTVHQTPEVVLNRLGSLTSAMTMSEKMLMYFRGTHICKKQPQSVWAVLGKKQMDMVQDGCSDPLFTNWWRPITYQTAATHWCLSHQYQKTPFTSAALLWWIPCNPHQHQTPLVATTQL